MAASDIPVPATWRLGDREWRATGFRWPASDWIVVRLVARERSAFSSVNRRIGEIRALRNQRRILADSLLKARAAREDAVRAAVELREANDQLERYASLVAHDLRAPLVTARALLDRLLDPHLEPASPELRAQVGAHLQRSLGRMDDLIVRLLEFSVSTDEPTLVHLALDELVAEVADDLHHEISETGARIVVEARHCCVADESLTRLVLRELVHNAIKYRDPARSPQIRVSTSAVPGVDGDRICVRTSDNGKGIPPNLRAEALRPARRLDPDPTVEGSGLGLSFCHRVAKLHGGRVTFDDGIGGDGLSVSIELPDRCDGHHRG